MAIHHFAHIRLTDTHSRSIERHITTKWNKFCCVCVPREGYGWRGVVFWVRMSSSASKIWTPGIQLNGNGRSEAPTVGRRGGGVREHMCNRTFRRAISSCSSQRFFIIIIYYYYSIHAARHRTQHTHTRVLHQLIEFSTFAMRTRCWCVCDASRWRCRRKM